MLFKEHLLFTLTMKTMQNACSKYKTHLMTIKIAGNYGYQQALTHIRYGSVIKKALLDECHQWYMISTNHYCQILRSIKHVMKCNKG
jgi:hypothetical protein